MLSITGLELLSHSKINHIQCIFGLLGSAHAKVCRLDVTVNNSLLVQSLDASYHLNAEVTHRFAVELLVRALV